MCKLVKVLDRTIPQRLPSIFGVRNYNSMSNFNSDLKSARKIVVLSGAGISAESGIPTFRTGGGYVWRNRRSTTLATLEAFRDNPSLVWEFYHYRREQIIRAAPNAAHKALVDYERKYSSGKEIIVVTQNIDNFHNVAGSKNVIELHGNIFKTRCTKCKNVEPNFDSPICKALTHRGDPEALDLPDIPVKLLPHCKKENCNGLLRPHVVWFGESLDSNILAKAEDAIDTCDMCLVIGTSSIVYPAAMFAPKAAARGAIVAEFNIEPAPTTEVTKYYFSGPCGETLPEALNKLTLE